jgi:hypothetical protein
MQAMRRLGTLVGGLAVGVAVAVAGPGGVPTAEAAVGRFDYTQVRRLDPRSGHLTIGYGMSGLRDAHVAVAPSMRATAVYWCVDRRARPAVTETTVTAAIARPEDLRDTVAQPDGTRAVQGEVTVTPPEAPAGFCAGGRLLLRGVTYDDPQLVARLVDDVSGLGSQKITGRLGFGVRLVTDTHTD